MSNEVRRRYEYVNDSFKWRTLAVLRYTAVVYADIVIEGQYVCTCTCAKWRIGFITEGRRDGMRFFFFFLKYRNKFFFRFRSTPDTRTEIYRLPYRYCSFGNTCLRCGRSVGYTSCLAAPSDEMVEQQRQTKSVETMIITISTFRQISIALLEEKRVLILWESYVALNNCHYSRKNGDQLRNVLDFKRDILRALVSPQRWWICARE